MFRKLFLFTKVITITLILALMTGIVMGFTYLLSILFSVGGFIVVVAIIVMAVCSEGSNKKEEP